MAKALVIKGADFETNRVAVIQFEGKHTTAISLSVQSLTLNSIGATQVLTATLTPQDSVDPIIWATSNSDVATVVNGLVTCIGVGTCTITATSGSYSATCTIDTEIYLDGIPYPYTLVDPKQSGNNKYTITSCAIGTSSATEKPYISMLDSVQVYADELLCGKMANNVATSGYDFQIIQPGDFENGTNEKRCYDNIGYPMPVRLPKGTTKIKCVGLSGQYGARAMFFSMSERALDTNEDINGGQYYCAARKRYTPTADTYEWAYQDGLEFDVPTAEIGITAYDAVVVVWKTDPSDATATLPQDMTQEQLAEFKVLCM